MFAEAFGYTPAEFRALTYADFNAMASFLNRKAESQRGH